MRRGQGRALLGALILGSVLSAPVKAGGVPTYDARTVVQDIQALMASFTSSVRVNCETSPNETVTVLGEPLVLDPKTCAEAREMGAMK